MNEGHAIGALRQASALWRHSEMAALASLATGAAVKTRLTLPPCP